MVNFTDRNARVNNENYKLPSSFFIDFARPSSSTSTSSSSSASSSFFDSSSSSSSWSVRIFRSPDSSATPFSSTCCARFSSSGSLKKKREIYFTNAFIELQKRSAVPVGFFWVGHVVNLSALHITIIRIFAGDFFIIIFGLFARRTLSRSFFLCFLWIIDRFLRLFL